MFTDIKYFPPWKTKPNIFKLTNYVHTFFFLLLRSKKGEIIDICGHICETPENVKERLKKS